MQLGNIYWNVKDGNSRTTSIIPNSELTVVPVVIKHVILSAVSCHQ